MLPFAAVALLTGGLGLLPSESTVHIKPLNERAVCGRPVEFRAIVPTGRHDTLRLRWSFGDGAEASGPVVRHTFRQPGRYHVRLITGADGHVCTMLLRVYRPGERPVPRVILDTDAKNEVDDQHYLAYALFSELDVLAINSAHHGGRANEAWQEAMNYAEIVHMLDLARCSGLDVGRIPPVFRGSPYRLVVPPSQRWQDTVPRVSEASEAILAAARGSVPGDPVWVIPVGPCTNVASAILQARREGLEVHGRLQICWLGGGPEHAHIDSFNGRNDPWAVHVVARSRLPWWVILERPPGASLTVDTRHEQDLYPDNPLGRYLRGLVHPIVLRRERAKSLYDVTAVATVIALARRLPWLVRVEPAELGGPDEKYRWKRAANRSAPLRLILDIDEDAMKRDFFNTLAGRPTRLRTH